MNLRQVDSNTLLLIQRYRPKFLNWFFILLTYSGTGKAWWVTAVILNILNYIGVQFVSLQTIFLRSMFGALAAWVLSSFLKKRFARKRPAKTLHELRPLIADPECGSFPSGHAASAFAFFFTLLLATHPLAPWVGVWAVLVSFSRAYLGVHYLSDVFGGAVLGFLSSLLIQAIVTV